jgi:precorrin-3B synthase
MNSPVAIKGWCPGALQPMPSGDGLLVRVRIPGAMLQPTDALMLAALARQHGNGAIDLTRRGNLQLRGVRDEAWPGLLDGLARLGLLAGDVAAEQTINIVTPPLGDCDPQALVDGRALASALEAALLRDTRLRALPSKFGFVIDDGGSLSHGDVEGDIVLEAFARHGETRIALYAGDDRCVLLEVAPKDVVATAIGLALAFLDCRGAGPDAPRRMSQLLLRTEPAMLRARLGSDPPPQPRQRRGGRALRPGLHGIGLTNALAVAAPFGAWTAHQIETLAHLALRAGGAIRTTPWKVLLVAPVADASSLDALAAAELVVTADDPRLSVAACPGAPACQSASVETRALARELAAMLPPAPDVRIHISGCAKGCARSEQTAFTLVGRDGRYDVVSDGRADATPRHEGLDAAQARRVILGDAVA